MSPENNGPLLIYRFTDFKKDDILYHGYILELQDVDLRFGEPNFVAYFLGNNEVVVKYPSTSYTFLYDTDVEAAGRRLANLVDDRLEQTVDVARNQIASDPARKFKHLLLTFPSKPNKAGAYPSP
ncbi:predicted protein [Phaeodactylum tricornutum CCAP 1055/1]|jgi:hypothetical protein|uniref:Uncharacterized protein n=2 Tax=Phaeodactylum tricornutum TaxID=2850 RepID=B7G1Q4_PHATC|nr:predicted protein [Phaeodactylum tricornutum CCAP 1055/1]EEC47725.1 predicted protein [Phaeodactylum tricornutum CCAP 1055/1]|eukprot:XP_002181073.1 predicted protein [Phaeodactylum tricornutum CCAP 1055/1]